MICYKDKSWCSASLGDPNERCKNYLCDKNFTPEEREISHEVLGNNCILSICNFKTKDCGYINENKKG